MSVSQVWTALLTLITVGLALALAVLGRACRRWRAASTALERRLDLLTGWLARLEARGHQPSRDTGARDGASIEIESAPAQRPGPTRRADPPSAPLAAGPALIAVPDLARRPLAKGPDDTVFAALERRFGEVWQRADAGVPVPVIAREAGLSIGRVELILGLRRRVTADESHRGPYRP